MKLFWLSRKKKNEAAGTHESEAKKASEGCATSVSTKSSVKSGGSRRKSSKSKQSTRDLGVEQAPPPPQINKYVQAVQTAMERMNSYVPGNPELYAQRIIDCFASPDSPLIAEDGEQYKTTDLADLCIMICKSFPDFHMKYGDVTYIDKGSSSTPSSIVLGASETDKIVAQVELDALIVSGTHTGEPYTIAPGVLPALEPSGKYVENDEQRMVFFLNNEAKIVKSQLVSLGVHTGAIGLYTLAGGDASPLLVQPKSE